MKIIKVFISGFVFFIAAFLLFSCNLEDFDLKKLASPDDVVPDVYAPLAYGTFKVEDLVTVPVPDDFSATAGSIFTLDPVFLDKTGTSFRSTAIDSVYLITNFTNNTPCDMVFELSFVNDSTGVQNGDSFTSEKIAAGAIGQKIQFDLGPDDQDNMDISTIIKLSFKLSVPANVAGPILYSAVKSKSFTVKISFYAPVNLRKL